MKTWTAERIMLLIVALSLSAFFFACLVMPHRDGV
jgi:hypothetical protein